MTLSGNRKAALKQWKIKIMILANCIHHRQTPAETIGWSAKVKAVGILWWCVWVQVFSKVEYVAVKTRVGRNGLTCLCYKSEIWAVLEQPAGRGLAMILERHWKMRMDLQRYGWEEKIRNQSRHVAGLYPDIWQGHTLIALASMYCQYELLLFFLIKLSHQKVTNIFKFFFLINASSWGQKF